MIKACIFDLDGVIVDTAKYHFQSWKRLAQHLEIPFTEEDNEKMKGISRMASLEKILELGTKEYSERDKQKFCMTKNTWYLEATKRMGSKDILPGILDFLSHLKEKNIKIALGSASKNARLVLDIIEIQEAFEIIVDGNDVKKSKPNPEVFLKAAAGLNVSPSETIVIEDSAKGIDAAISGGFLSIGIGLEEHLSHASMVLPSLENITISEITNRICK
ncbi:MAG: beta-phosphoglucomutase [Saprospiraceae bacterium]|jgi:beta-phosphoglucomutase